MHRLPRTVGVALGCVAGLLLSAGCSAGATKDPVKATVSSLVAQMHGPIFAAITSDAVTGGVDHLQRSCESDALGRSELPPSVNRTYRLADAGAIDKFRAVFRDRARQNAWQPAGSLREVYPDRAFIRDVYAQTRGRQGYDLVVFVDEHDLVGETEISPSLPLLCGDKQQLPESVLTSVNGHLLAEQDVAPGAEGLGPTEIDQDPTRVSWVSNVHCYPPDTLIGSGPLAIVKSFHAGELSVVEKIAVHPSSSPQDHVQRMRAWAAKCTGGFKEAVGEGEDLVEFQAVHLLSYRPRTAADALTVYETRTKAVGKKPIDSLIAEAGTSDAWIVLQQTAPAGHLNVHDALRIVDSAIGRLLSKSPLPDPASLSIK